MELGPGTGAFTRTIQERLDGRGWHIALDVNERFTALLTERFPAVDALTADARDLPALLTERGLSQADAIVSGLPWASFRPERQRELLDAVVHARSPRGAFTTFACIHARRSTPACRLRRSLADRFEEVVLGRTVWANRPPALVYHCRRPRHQDGQITRRSVCPAVPCQQVDPRRETSIPRSAPPVRGSRTPGTSVRRPRQPVWAMRRIEVGELPAGRPGRLRRPAIRIVRNPCRRGTVHAHAPYKPLPSRCF
ncbi:class I SAM-dependent methyltransferase [Streptomyces sp. NPDC001933]|uniref:class I SAM-dependent methyltransferase n=1 Tax=Streptomyces sp. NPDC001933 TaxID=3364626 RepID=UPI003675960F